MTSKDSPQLPLVLFSPTKYFQSLSCKPPSSVLASHKLVTLSFTQDQEAESADNALPAASNSSETCRCRWDSVDQNPRYPKYHRHHRRYRHCYLYPSLSVSMDSAASNGNVISNTIIIIIGIGIIASTITIRIFGFCGI